MSALHAPVNPFELSDAPDLLEQLNENMTKALAEQDARLWVGVLREKARQAPPGPDRVAELRTQFENRWPTIYDAIMTGWDGQEDPSILKLTYKEMRQLEHELQEEEA
jgi:hypothetical protein